MKRTKEAAFLRQELLIDANVQGSLLCRMALYSAGCGVYFIVILLFTESMGNPNEAISDTLLRCLEEALYWIPGLMLLLPVVAYDLLRVSNRFTGPMFRLKREMHRLVLGESVHRLSFRADDYWIEMADLFNSLRDELLELRQSREQLGPLRAVASDAAGGRKLFIADEHEVDDPRSSDDRLAHADA
jgi:hypothetical protein